MAAIRKNFISHPQVVYKKSEIKSATGLNLRSAEWAVLTQVDGLQTLSEIAATLSMSAKEVARIMYTLFQHELVIIHSAHKKEESFVSPRFFEDIQTNLTMIIGPVAPYVIDDVLQEMNLGKLKFPLDKAAEFIENVSDEIEDDQKKIIFQSRMLEYLKKAEY